MTLLSCRFKFAGGKKASVSSVVLIFKRLKSSDIEKALNVCE